MKKLLPILLLSVFYYSCQNECDNLECHNGFCSESTPPECICDQWWEGDKYNRETRHAYLGGWLVNSNCSDVNYYFFNITRGSDVNEIIITSQQFNGAISIIAERPINGTLISDTEVSITDFRIRDTNYSGNLEMTETGMLMTINVQTESETTICEYHFEQ